ncbi:MAG TPA: glycosyltransferase family 2 protein [Flavobacteriaceae bacterium]|nr:glycosyltransferase family 2 protein [Flavobacteriaceae bacterium]
MKKISALLITYNEREHLPDVIDTVDFADEIIVVDSYSDDGTAEYLQEDSRVKLIQHPFRNFSEQRNFALKHAQYPWVLFIDADERIPKKLREEIKKTVNLPDPKAAYYFRRQFLFKNKPLRFSGYQTDKNHRLFQKEKAYYCPERLVHEILEVEGKSGVLKNKLLHYSFNDYEEYKQKMLSYGRLRAVELSKKNLEPGFFHFYIKPTYKFLSHYVIRLGFLDGKKGFCVSYLNALSVAERYRELIRMEHLVESSPKQEVFL